MIQFECEHCRRPVRVADSHGGKKGRCPHCRQVVAIPARGEEIAALAAALGSQLNDDSTLGTVPPPPATRTAPAADDDLLLPADDGLADTVILPAEAIAPHETSALDHYHLRPVHRPPPVNTRRTFVIVAIAIVVLAAAILGFIIITGVWR